jgi:A/G-specific adenine glycosylase
MESFTGIRATFGSLGRRYLTSIEVSSNSPHKQTVNPLDARAIRAALTRWYRRNHRDLPWRRTRDPYAIWVSEIMLQQTRVAAVIPYYQRFMTAFPNAAALAAAPEEQVLAMWSGLGYYSRARNMQKAATRVVQNGVFPPDFDSIRALPGIGDYTAAAISSIAFGLPHAAVDGNVRRVIVRLLNDDAADVQGAASRLLDRRDPGRWNQAVMEFGATICAPRDPGCDQCPVARYCEAHKHGTQASLPSKRLKPKPEKLERTLLIFHHRGRILLTPSSRVKGFWDLPEMIDGTQGAGIRAGLMLGWFRHTITHRHYKFVVCEGIAGEGLFNSARSQKQYRWVARRKLPEIALSTTAKKALRLADRVLQ